jgi:hypothetical protein
LVFLQFAFVALKLQSMIMVFKFSRIRFHAIKLVKILDAQGTILVSDALKQLILQKLVASQRSITELSRELNVFASKICRRMQRLMKAKLVEVSVVEN